MKRNSLSLFKCPGLAVTSGSSISVVFQKSSGGDFPPLSPDGSRLLPNPPL